MKGPTPFRRPGLGGSGVPDFRAFLEGLSEVDKDKVTRLVQNIRLKLGLDSAFSEAKHVAVSAGDAEEVRVLRDVLRRINAPDGGF